MNALFITEQNLLDASILNENISYAQIRPTLVKAQEMRIQPVLGSTLYKELVTQIAANDVTAANQTLLNDYVQPALVQWVYYELPMVLAYRFMNKGMVRRSSDESTPMSMEEIARLTERVKNDAEWYSERITRFLVENRDDYPGFNLPDPALDTIYPNPANYNAGMVLDTRTRLRGVGLDLPPGYPDPYSPYYGNLYNQ